MLFCLCLRKVTSIGGFLSIQQFIYNATATDQGNKIKLSRACSSRYWWSQQMLFWRVLLSMRPWLVLLSMRPWLVLLSMRPITIKVGRLCGWFFESYKYFWIFSKKPKFLDELLLCLVSGLEREIWFFKQNMSSHFLPWQYLGLIEEFLPCDRCRLQVAFDIS